MYVYVNLYKSVTSSFLVAGFQTLSIKHRPNNSQLPTLHVKLQHLRDLNLGIIKTVFSNINFKLMPLLRSRTHSQSLFCLFA